MSRGASGKTSAVGATDPVPPGLAVQHVGTWSAASELLLRSALERWCGQERPNQARRTQLDLSQVIVATYHDQPIGLTGRAEERHGLNGFHCRAVHAIAHTCTPLPRRSICR
jgi:hypothetical protein